MVTRRNAWCLPALVTVLLSTVGAVLPRSAVATAACIGDCNGDGTVTITELITGVNIALETDVVTACPATDANRDGHITIDELVAAVRNDLDGCPATPTVGSVCERK